MRLSLLLTLLPFATAFRSPHPIHHRLRRADQPVMSSPSLSSPSIFPSFPLTSLSIPLPSSLPPSSVQSTPLSSSALPLSTSTPTPSSTASSSPSVFLPSATPSSSTASTSSVVYTSFTPSTSAVFALPQPSSSFTPTTLPAPTQVPSSVVVLTSTLATPSSTPTQSSSSGFFSNTGAVAGTFTVVGLVAIAGVIAVALLIARRRHSRSYEDDTEYLDKSPDPPITQVTSLDDGSNSDHAHFGAPPMALATPPMAYYPDHPYAPHPQAFSEAYPPPGPRGYPSSYPVAYTQDYAAQRIYSPEDYDTSRVPANMPNPHQFTNVELVSAPIPPTRTPLPNALRPSVKSTPSAPEQWESARFSVDSFYAGIASDTLPSSGRAL